MSDPPRPSPGERTGEGPRDDEYSQAYADGYGEGLRDALRDILSHLSRGHTPHEVRMIVESRLARVRDEVELKRKSLLAPPRRPSWGAILRPPSPPGSDAPTPGAAPSSPVERGQSLLFLEESPTRSIACVAASASRFARVMVLSFHAPSLPGVPPDRVDFVPVRSGDTAGGGDPGSLAGRVSEAVAREGGTLVYLDALEVLISESGAEVTSKFVTWIASRVANGASAFVVSADPASLGQRERGLYQRTFNSVR